MALASLSKEQKDEYAVTYAALALWDGGAEVTTDKIKEILEATGCEVEAYWPMIAAKFFSGDRMAKFIMKPGGGGGGGRRGHRVAAPLRRVARSSEADRDDAAGRDVDIPRAQPRGGSRRRRGARRGF